MGHEVQIVYIAYIYARWLLFFVCFQSQSHCYVYTQIHIHTIAHNVQIPQCAYCLSARRRFRIKWVGYFVYGFLLRTRRAISHHHAFGFDVPSTIKHAIDLCTEWWIAIHYLCEAVCIHLHRNRPWSERGWILKSAVCRETEKEFLRSVRPKAWNFCLYSANIEISIVEVEAKFGFSSKDLHRKNICIETIVYIANK